MGSVNHQFSEGLTFSIRFRIQIDGDAKGRLSRMLCNHAYLRLDIFSRTAPLAGPHREGAPAGGPHRRGHRQCSTLTQVQELR